MASKNRDSVFNQSRAAAADFIFKDMPEDLTNYEEGVVEGLNIEVCKSKEYL